MRYFGQQWQTIYGRLLNSPLVYIIIISFLSKTYEGIAVGLVINKSADCVINRCEIKGTNSKSIDKRTVGILNKFGGLLIRESKILN